MTDKEKAQMVAVARCYQKLIDLFMELSPSARAGGIGISLDIFEQTVLPLFDLPRLDVKPTDR